MADKTLEDKAVEILDASQTAITAFSDKLAELAKQYGPDVVDGALTLARVDALSEVFFPAIIFAVMLLAACFLPRMWTALMAKEKAWEDAGDSYKTGGAIAVGAVASVVWLATFIISMVNTMNFWAWAGVIDPKLWLAKKILGL